VHVAHFFAEDLERVVADREVVRLADRDALRGMVGREERPLVEREGLRAAEPAGERRALRWELMRPVEATSEPQRSGGRVSMTSLRIIMHESVGGFVKGQ
jgi:hypothetical protein